MLYTDVITTTNAFCNAEKLYILTEEVFQLINAEAYMYTYAATFYLFKNSIIQNIAESVLNDVYQSNCSKLFWFFSCSALLPNYRLHYKEVNQV